MRVMTTKPWVGAQLPQTLALLTYSVDHALQQSGTTADDVCSRVQSASEIRSAADVGECDCGPWRMTVDWNPQNDATNATRNAADPKYVLRTVEETNHDSR